MEAKKPIEKELLTINEVAELLRVHPQTLRRWDEEGKLKAVRIGEKGHRKYKLSEIKKLLN
jgi:excisionase family DNA binding protein